MMWWVTLVMMKPTLFPTNLISFIKIGDQQFNLYIDSLLDWWITKPMKKAILLEQVHSNNLVGLEMLDLLTHHC